MGIFLLSLYLFASFFFPAEMFPSLAPYHLPYWIGIGGLAVSVVLVFARRGEPLRTIQMPLLLAFFAVLMLSWLIADRSWGAVRHTIQEFAPSLTMCVLTVCAVDSLRKLRAVAGLVVAFSFLVLAQGIAAYHFGLHEKQFVLNMSERQEDQPEGESLEQKVAPEPDEPTERADEEGGVARRIRGLGMLHDPNDLALTFVVALPLISIPGRRLRLPARILESFLFVALCYGVYLTHSRGGALALLCVAVCVLHARIGRGRAVLLAAVLVIGALAIDIGGGRNFSLQDESAAERIDAWAEGLQMLKSHPLTGVGYRQFTEHHYMTAHNSFVLCFAETGLVGYFLWLSLLGVSLLQLQKLKHVPSEPDVRRLASILQTALTGFMVAAFFLSRTYVPFLYLLIGLSAALVRIVRQKGVRVMWPSYLQMGSLVAAAEAASIVLIYVIGRVQPGA